MSVCHKMNRHIHNCQNETPWKELFEIIPTVGSHDVLIQWAVLGRFMRHGRQWACAGLRNLQVDGTAIIRPPTSLVYLTNLEELSVSGCKESTSKF